MLEFPRAAIQTVVEILLSGEYRERAGELAEAVMQIVVYGTKVIFENGGPLAAAEPLSDEQALLALNAMLAAEGQPQAALDPTLWQPLVTYLLQLVLSRLFAK